MPHRLPGFPSDVAVGFAGCRAGAVLCEKVGLADNPIEAKISSSFDGGGDAFLADAGAFFFPRLVICIAGIPEVVPPNALTGVDMGVATGIAFPAEGFRDIPLRPPLLVAATDDIFEESIVFFKGWRGDLVYLGAGVGDFSPNDRDRLWTLESSL